MSDTIQGFVEADRVVGVEPCLFRTAPDNCTFPYPSDLNRCVASGINVGTNHRITCADAAKSFNRRVLTHFKALRAVSAGLSTRP
jgi:hypothetical protein